MKKAKLQFSIKLPSGYNEVLKKGRQYLMEHPDLIGKYAGKIIFVSDVFQWGLDMVADHLDIEFKNNGDIEIVTADKLVPSNVEIKLCRILSSKDFNILEKYRYKGFMEKMDVFEFCDLEGIDWKALLRDDNTNK